MKTLSSQQPNSILKEVLEIEDILEANVAALGNLELEVESYDKNSTDRLTGIREVMNLKMKLSKEATRLAIVKAKIGIVGDSWYNEPGGDAS